ncbi:MAG: hypothetical protein C0501_03395 [Isosphaera sp.]|nr:hypothetical protein [Isosphaera sp.]
MTDPRDPDPAGDEPLFEGGPANPRGWDEPAAPAPPPPAAVSCWRCGRSAPPVRGRCPACRARLTEEDDREDHPYRPRPPRRPAADEGTVLTLVVVYAVMLFVSVVWGWVSQFGGAGMTEDDFLLGTAVVEAVDAVLVLVALAVVGRSPLPAVSAGGRAWAWAAGVPALAGLLLAGHLYLAVIREIVRPIGGDPPDVPLTAVAVLLMCLQPAVVEELFFRYVAFGALFRSTGLHATVWVSAVMFAGAHLYNPIGMPYLLLAGVVLGYARVWGGLALPMVMHFAHNFVVVFVEGG